MSVYNDLDFFLIKSIYKGYKKNKKISIWDLTKQYFDNKNTETREERRKLNHKYQYVIQRLKIMRKNGFLFISKNKNNHYEYFLIKDKVKFGKHKFPNGTKNSISILENSKWNIFEL